MKPIYLAGLILLALTLVFAVVGMVLAGRRVIRLRTATTYSRVCTVLVLASAYALTQFDWPGVHLRSVDFWSLLVILGISVYALIWAAIAFQLNQSAHEEFGESFMLSMLHNDIEPHQHDMPAAKKSGSGKQDSVH
jgi:hypothetical protein